MNSRWSSPKLVDRPATIRTACPPLGGYPFPDPARATFQDMFWAPSTTYSWFLVIWGNGTILVWCHIDVMMSLRFQYMNHVESWNIFQNPDSRFEKQPYWLKLICCAMDEFINLAKTCTGFADLDEDWLTQVWLGTRLRMKEDDVIA